MPRPSAPSASSPKPIMSPTTPPQSWEKVPKSPAEQKVREVFTPAQPSPTADRTTNPTSRPGQGGTARPGEKVIQSPKIPLPTKR